MVLALGTCRDGSRGPKGESQKQTEAGRDLQSPRKELFQVISLCLVTEGGPLLLVQSPRAQHFKRTKLKTSEFQVRKGLLIEKLPTRR